MTTGYDLVDKLTLWRDQDLIADHRCVLCAKKMWQHRLGLTTCIGWRTRKQWVNYYEKNFGLISQRNATRFFDESVGDSAPVAISLPQSRNDV